MAQEESPTPSDSGELSAKESYPELNSFQRGVKKFLEWFRAFLIAFVLILILRWLVAEPFIVAGPSMKPTLKNRQVVLVQKLAPTFFEINKGDIIVFVHPQNPQKKLIKRVVAVGGEKVKIRRGKVYINDIQIDEKYLLPRKLRRANYGPLEIPSDHYFVLGDNRSNSLDSRQGWLVPAQNIIGVAFLRILPPREISGL